MYLGQRVEDLHAVMRARGQAVENGPPTAHVCFGANSQQQDISKYARRGQTFSAEQSYTAER